MSYIGEKTLYELWKNMMAGLCRLKIILMRKKENAVEENEKKTIQEGIDKLIKYKKKLTGDKGGCLYTLRKKPEYLDKMGTKIDNLLDEYSKKYNIDISFYVTYHEYNFYNGFFIFTKSGRRTDQYKGIVEEWRIKTKKSN